ncbi:UNVERIFIED_CONTAM: diguanylate cyclase, partial [Salmonella enterica subsp. enterica serovar Weltevreden]
GSGDMLKLSVSIGVASAPCEQADIAELLERADQAMYIAKRAGRNRVHAWQPPDTANA